MARNLVRHKPEEVVRSSVEGRPDRDHKEIDGSTPVVVVERIVLAVAEVPTTVVCQSKTLAIDTLC